MPRATLKLKKPVDPAAPPKELTSRARRALHGKALPKPSSSAKSAATATPPATPASAAARPAAGTAARAGERRRATGVGKPAPDRTGFAAKPKSAGPRSRDAGSASSRARAGESAPPRARGPAGPPRHAGDNAATAPAAEPRRHQRRAGGQPGAAAPVERRVPRPLSPPPPPSTRHENPDHPRLSKRMSELGLCSRREADEWIENGWVRVDGKVVATLGVRVSPHARIEIDPAAAQHQSEQVTILLNKPIGYVSAQAEDGYEPAMVLIKPENRWAEDPSPTRFKPGHLRGLAPAGRLDIDSTGLIVFTQDGRIAKHLIGRDSAVEKEYLVRVEGTLSDEGMKLLQHGLELDGVKLKPARVSWQNEHQLRFVLREGRKRQIRRMCELVGLTVTGLKRVRSGGVPLGPLPVGQWRYLRRDEKF